MRHHRRGDWSLPPPLMVEVKMMGSDDLYRTKDEMSYVVFR